jgi:Zn-finger nucleic acid-binding protein
MAPSRKPSCPVCKTPLREEAAEGVTAALCPEHGLWLSKEVLRTIVERIKLAQMTKARRVLRTTASSDLAETSMTEGVLGRWWKKF